MRYIPNTAADRREMLAELGFESIEDLFAAVPEEMRLGRPLDLPSPSSEKALFDLLGELGRRNASSATHACPKISGLLKINGTRIVDS